jgi:hypothetical protein
VIGEKQIWPDHTWKSAPGAVKTTVINDRIWATEVKVLGHPLGLRPPDRRKVKGISRAVKREKVRAEAIKELPDVRREPERVGRKAP